MLYLEDYLESKFLATETDWDGGEAPPLSQGLLGGNFKLGIHVQ
jgi:hypothetical protein